MKCKRLYPSTSLCSAVLLVSFLLVAPAFSQTIIKQPVGGKVFYGYPRGFEVWVEGEGDYGYQWYIGAVGAAEEIGGAIESEVYWDGAADLSGAEITAPGDYELYCVLEGPGGLVESRHAAIRVQDAPPPPEVTSFVPLLVNAEGEEDPGFSPPIIEDGIGFPALTNVLPIRGELDGSQQGWMVTVGGGLYPVYQQLDARARDFDIKVPLKQNAVNHLSIRAVAANGEYSAPAEFTVWENSDSEPGFPLSGVVDTLHVPNEGEALSIGVDLDNVEVFGSQATLSAELRLTDDTLVQTFDVGRVTEWEVTKDAITAGGLYTMLSPEGAIVTARVTYGGVAYQTTYDMEEFGLMPLTGKMGGAKANGFVSGVVLDRYAGDSLTTAIWNGLAVAKWNGGASFRVFNILSGGYGGWLPEGVKSFYGNATGYTKRGPRAKTVSPSTPLTVNFLLNRNDNWSPLTEILGLSKKTNAKTGRIDVSGIVWDQFSGVNSASLILDAGFPIDILDAITPEGFYRARFYTSAGDHTVQLGAVDTAGLVGTAEAVAIGVANVPLYPGWAVVMLGAAGLAILRRRR